MKDKILELLTISDVLQKYGYKIGRHNRIKCMLHNGESNMSFSYKENVFHCFGCDASGDIISLVMQMFGLDFKSALIKINYDFGLGLTNAKPTYREIRQQAKAQQERKRVKLQEEAHEKDYEHLLAYRFGLWKQGKEGYNFIDRVLEDEPKEIIKYLGIGKYTERGDFR